MKHIDHLTPEEKEHFILCDCGHYIDMRDLGEVMQHLHIKEEIKAEWSCSVRVGTPVAYTKGKQRDHLN